ncbi:MAG: S-layer homology domain-containing protein [Clostridia bacterium]|nr:S-layer homology domain-containing protein [Clostridia bacterium]
MKQFMEKYVKGMMIFAMGIMGIGLTLFFVNFSMSSEENNYNAFLFDDDTDIQIEDEGVPMGLWKGDLEEVEERITPYTDIVDHWAKDYIMTIIDKEVMSPITDTTFEPNRKVTRAEFITILGKTENIDKTGRTVKNYKDVPAESIYAPYIA